MRIYTSQHEIQHCCDGIDAGFVNYWEAEIIDDFIRKTGISEIKESSGRARVEMNISEWWSSKLITKITLGRHCRLNEPEVARMLNDSGLYSTEVRRSKHILRGRSALCCQT